MRMNISVPDCLKDEMDSFELVCGVNWSLVARKAFRKHMRRRTGRKDRLGKILEKLPATGSVTMEELNKLAKKLGE